MALERWLEGLYQSVQDFEYTANYVHKSLSSDIRGPWYTDVFVSIPALWSLVLRALYSYFKTKDKLLRPAQPECCVDSLLLQCIRLSISTCRLPLLHCCSGAWLACPPQRGGDRWKAGLSIIYWQTGISGSLFLAKFSMFAIYFTAAFNGQKAQDFMQKSLR